MTTAGRGAYQVANLLRSPLTHLHRWLLDGDITGREHLPNEGPYIVTANHLSLIDPILVSVAVGRLVRFLALDELFGNNWLLDHSMLYFGAIPVSRERPPLGALKEALAALDNAEVVGIFPEGARARHWGSRPIKHGAAWLAVATGAPIIPCAVTGTETTLSLDEPRFRLPAVRLTLHPPIEPDPYLEREDPIGSMMDDWTRVIDSEMGHWVHEE